MIQIENLSKRYGELEVLNTMSLHIQKGSIFGIIGQSGAGKSTLLRCINGLETFDSGRILVDGIQISTGNDRQAREARREIGMVFQNFSLLDRLNVYDNVAFPMKSWGYKKKEIDERVRELIGLVDLNDKISAFPPYLSGGQKQRVAIGSAIIRKPKAFLMDEPLSNLDAKLRAQMRIELAKLHRELGTTMIYVTHDQTEAMTLGTRIVVMKDGVVQQVESPANIYNNPRNQFVAGFIGSPSMNFFDAYIGEEEGRTTLYLGGTELGKKVYVDGSRGQLLKEQENGKKVVIGIRPEDIWEYEDAVHRGFDEASVDIVETITAREMPGAEVILYFDAQNKSHAVRLRLDNQTRTGEKLQLYFDPEKLHVFDKETGENLFYREEVSV